MPRGCPNRSSRRPRAGDHSQSGLWALPGGRTRDEHKTLLQGRIKKRILLLWSSGGCHADWSRPTHENCILPPPLVGSPPRLRREVGRSRAERSPPLLDHVRHRAFARSLYVDGAHPRLSLLERLPRMGLRGRGVVRLRSPRRVLLPHVGNSHPSQGFVPEPFLALGRRPPCASLRPLALLRNPSSHIGVSVATIRMVVDRDASCHS